MREMKEEERGNQEYAGMIKQEERTAGGDDNEKGVVRGR